LTSASCNEEEEEEPSRERGRAVEYYVNEKRLFSLHIIVRAACKVIMSFLELQKLLKGIKFL
jgi:hypothetical protein